MREDSEEGVSGGSGPAKTGAQLRVGVQFAVACGGSAALSWEILWQLKASLALGVSALGTAVTLATTMFGMAVGSFVSGRVLRARDLARPVRAYAALEAAIGLAGLAMLPAFVALEHFDAWLYGLSPAAAPLGHALGIALVVGPAAIAMGATVPVFQLVARGSGVPVSVLYGLNTAGACLGVLGISFVLLPAFGVITTAAIVAAVNFSVAVALWLAPPTQEERAFDEAKDGDAANDGERASDGVPRLGAQVAAVLVFTTGLATFGLEVAWFRAMRAAFWSTTDTFAIILASVLAPLAISARCVPWIRRRGIHPGVVVAAAGVAILLATPLVERMDLFATASSTYALTLSRWLALSVAVVGPPILLLGMALPWCLESFPSPRASGWLYALNTVGAVAGSLLAAWWWLPTLGFARTAWLLGAAVLIVGGWASPPARRRVTALAGGAAFLVALGMASSPGRDRAYREPDFGQSQVIEIREGPDSTASVVETQGARMLLIDGFVATSETIDAGYMAWMGRLPMLLHPEPRESLVICFGTGLTAWSVLDEDPNRVDVVDVSRDVLELAPHFTSNNGVLDDERVNPIVMDGRAWLRRTAQDYDVITLEPMPPSFAGVNALYSREFYELMLERLTPNGVVAQWLPFHLVPPEHSRAIAATFIEVFPDALLWVDPVDRTGILVGRREAASRPLGTTWPGFDRARRNRPLSDGMIERSAVLDADALRRYVDGADSITDDNQLLSFGKFHAGLKGRLAREFGATNRAEVARLAREAYDERTGEAGEVAD